jgi:phosphoglycerol transferase MdoB-like AlkP superfamily enzyme
MSWMLNQIIRLFKYFIFRMIFFWLAKVLFLLFNWRLCSQLSIGEILGTFGYGLKMDVSTTSYSSLLSTSIMVYPEKSHSITLLPEYFNRKNYHTSFYYGGDINFYNLKTFVLQSNWGKITTKSDFPTELGRMSKWGVPDGYVFKGALEDLKSGKRNFMNTIYTVSSHSPHDVPYSKIKGNSLQKKYLNFTLARIPLY